LGIVHFEISTERHNDETLTNRLKLHTKPHAAQISAAKAGSARAVVFKNS